jgi:DNA segregation ATPase FtsK/SpoIIIE, S-DNA-T family
MTYRDPSRYYRRRMRRGRRGRRGAYPVMFPIDYEPVFLLAALAAGRWAYRHRSAFLPFMITGAAFTLAASLHHHHREWWIVTAGATMTATFVLAIPHRLLWERPAGKITAGVLARVWEACGIGRPIERAYAALVVAVTGGWLAAAIAAGPAVKPLPVIAAIATVVVGVPWWAHRRRRARVRAERTIQTWPFIAEDIGLPGSRITSIVVDVWGWTARVVLKKGSTAAQAIDRLPAIESGLGLRPGSARAIPDPDKAGRFTLRVIEADPHAHPIPWPGPMVTSITGEMELGLFQDGRPAKVLLLRRNVLVGGIIDSGKSGVLNVITGNLAACRDAVIWGIDLRGGMELQPWASCLERIATTPQEAIALFKDAIGELNNRASRMARQGKRLWEPTPDDPALVIVIDEYAELPDEAHDYSDSIARRGRAVAVNIIAATQRPTQKMMHSNAVRSQMDVRICLRVRERRDVELILGQGAVTSGWNAHTLTQPGMFLISAREHTVPHRARAYLVTDAQVARYAAGCAGGRLRLHRNSPPKAAGWPQKRDQAQEGTEPQLGGLGPFSGPETALWAALRRAGPDGVTVAALVKITGKGRTWVYERLHEHAAAGRAVQTIRGHWRAADAGGPRSGQAGG